MNESRITPGKVLDYLLAKLVEGARHLGAAAYGHGKRLAGRILARA